MDPRSNKRIDRRWKSNIDSAWHDIHHTMVKLSKECAQVRTKKLRNRETMRESLSNKVGIELVYGEMEGIEQLNMYNM